MCLIGNRQTYSFRKTVASGTAAERLTTNWPVVLAPSKSQWDTVSTRSCLNVTGHAARYNPALTTSARTCAGTG